MVIVNTEDFFRLAIYMYHILLYILNVNHRDARRKMYEPEYVKYYCRIRFRRGTLQPSTCHEQDFLVRSGD